MEFSIIDEGEYCSLTAKDCATSNVFRVAVTKATLLEGLRTILADPEAKEIIAGNVLLFRKKAGIVVAPRAGAQFEIPISTFPAGARMKKPAPKPAPETG
ncbi:MAG: hypothetical protein IPL47_15005 [Phyllobacteriaceae bacterium]|nr:hypothetical protein [Phyllobacteriaceae bacterium]